MANVVKPTQPVEPAGKTSAVKPILIVCGVLTVLVLCCCSVFAIFIATSKDFKDSFKQGYCEGLAEENIRPEDDPFKFCL